MIAWVEPTELSDMERDDAGLRRIVKAAAAVAVFCMLVAFGPALLVGVDENRSASLDGARLVHVTPAVASGTQHQGETPRYASVRTILGQSGRRGGCDEG